MYIKLVLLTVALFSVQSGALEGGTLSYCYNGRCNQNSGYQGPMNTYEDSGSGGSQELNDRNYEAYRYGKTKELQDYRGELEKKQVDFERSRMGGQANSQQLTQIASEIHKQFDRVYPSPPAGVLSQEQRSTLNPAPAGMDAAKVKREVDPLWNRIQAGDAVGVSEELDKLQQRMLSIDGSGISSIPASEGKYIDNDLRDSGVTNGQGLLEAPFAETPRAPLYNSAQTAEGAELRHGMNQVLAAQSVFGSACAANSSQAAACAAAQIQMRATINEFYVLDRLIYDQGGLSNPATRQFASELHAVAQFAAGLAAGVYKGSLDLLEGLAQMVQHPVDTVVNLADALTSLETLPLIIKAVEDKYEQFKNGDAYTRGEILGEVSVQVASQFIPGPDVGEILNASKDLLRPAMAEAIARAVQASEKLRPVMSGPEARAALIASHWELPAEKAAEFTTWATKNLDVGDRGELAITFARRMDPERYEFIRGVQDAMGTTVSEDAKKYIVSQYTYEHKIVGVGEKLSAEQLTNSAVLYDQYAAKFGGVAAQSAPPEGFLVSRGVGKEFDFYGTKTANTADSVFIANRNGEFASFRYSRPGESAIYTTLEPGAKAVIELETGRPAGDLLFGTTTVSPQKILDLTDPAVLAHLGVEPAQLVRASSGYGYETPQVLGSLARQQGYDAIISYSEKVPKQKNLILFK